MVSSKAFMMMARRQDHKIIFINPATDFNWSADQKDLLQRLARMDLYPETNNTSTLSKVTTTADFEKFHEKPQYFPDTEIQACLSPQLKDMYATFNKRNTDTLPLRGPHDFKIELKPRAKLPFKRPYGMSQEELAAVKEYIDENLAKGFIRLSTAEISSPVLLVKKPGRGLRFCVDYRGLNAITIKNRYPIPLIRETLDRFRKAKRYTKLDIIAALNRIRIREGDQDLVTFITRYSTYRYKVLPFKVSNGPGSFQAYINSILREYIDIFVCI
jgi:hypothetical protein